MRTLILSSMDKLILIIDTFYWFDEIPSRILEIKSLIFRYLLFNPFKEPRTEEIYSNALSVLPRMLPMISKRTAEDAVNSV